MLDALQEALARSIHRVFWVGTILASLALLVSLWLPRAGAEGIEPPTEDTCCAETGERMVIAEFATLEPEDEPVAARGD